MAALVPLHQIPPDQVEGLLDRAFGPGRGTRTAYRVRVGTAALPGLSFAALDEAGSLVGSIQAWPVSLTSDQGRAAPLVMVGPVAVTPVLQGTGIGIALMRRLIDAAERDPDPGASALMLIGDPEYYGRFFGFSAKDTAGWRLPGPVERRRLLAKGEGVPAGDGSIGPHVCAAG